MTNEYKVRCLDSLKKSRLLKIASGVGVTGVNQSTTKKIIISEISLKSKARLKTILNRFQKKELVGICRYFGKDSSGKKDQLIQRILSSAGTWDIFISYAGKDAGSYQEAQEALEKRYKVWLDKNEMYGGAYIKESIDTGILESLLAVIFVSQAYNEREHTKYELNLISEYQKPKIPVVSEEHKPAINQHFNGIHYVTWDGDKNSFLDEIEKSYASVKLA